MRTYEMMTIFHPELDASAQEESVKKIEKLIKDNSGNIDSVDHWGKKRLAYEINHIKEGQYSIFNFAGTAGTVDEVSRVLKISDDVVRFMIVKRPDKDKEKQGK